MASRDNCEDFKGRIIEVLKHLQPKDGDRHEHKTKASTWCDIKAPSSAAELMGPDFRVKTKERVRAVRESFERREIAIEYEGGPSKKSSSHSRKEPQERGQRLHQELSNQIREKRKGELLREIEKEYSCTFLLAEVVIYGFAARKSKKVFYSGRIDALAFHQTPGGDPEVYVVDWKTSAKDDLPKLEIWWNEAKYFKRPLYQCLLYRELLQTHLEVHNITARVGIMLVPFHQAHPELIMPGLCKDFQEMEGAGLLDDLKKYQWFSEESRCVHTVTLPCNLFNHEHLSTRYLENGILKEDTLVKDIVDKDATVKDLCQELGLLKLKIELSSTEDSSSDPEGTRDEKGDESKAKKRGILKRFFNGKK